VDDARKLEDEIRKLYIPRLPPGYELSLSIRRKELFEGKIQPEAIIEIVCFAFGLKPEALLMKSSKQNIVMVRQFVSKMLRTYTRLSFKRIGELAGFKDHSGAQRAIRRLQDMLDTDPFYEQKIIEIENLLQSNF